MKTRALYSLIAILTAFIASAQITWNRSHLDEVKANIDQPYYATTYRALLKNADEILNAPALSVIIKEKTAASGDKHDYLSQARYFWPDTTKTDGLPYIERDGITNPEIETLDRLRLSATTGRINTLALAWYFSGDEKYAAKAAELIRIWFIDKATRMNPNLEYAQVVWGQNGNKGRCYGLIDSYSLLEVLNGISLLESSKSFGAKDRKALRRWYADFSKWMINSPQGKEESAAANNHSVAYDAQIIGYSIFAGDSARARKIIADVPAKRIFSQIKPDGSQPHELRRTLALHYSNYNLGFFIDIMTMAQRLGIDLGDAVSSEGAGIYKAADFLAAYLGKDAPAWPYKQISGMEGARQNLCKNLYRLGRYLCNEGNPRAKVYLKAYAENRKYIDTDIFNLIHYKADITDHAFAHAAGQLRLGVIEADKARKEPENAKGRKVEPRSITADGSLVMVHPHDWCSGFFPGSLWQMYSYTNDPEWRRTAISWTWPIEEAKWHRGTHDLGFMMGDSFGKAYAITGEQSYRDVMLQAARTLITRFNPTVGCICSWDHNRELWHYPVIIDNLMNLEMLFEASRLTGDPTFSDVAISHADKTLANHFRPDHSSFHVVDYDPETGEARLRMTHQGYSDDSYWSRGQAWGLYGYTTCYRYTHDSKYLQKSEAIADFILSLPNMPADGIPYWDMKMPEIADCTPERVNVDVPRDASAAAIIASGLYELSDYVSPEKAAIYAAHADKIVNSLYYNYTAPKGSSRGFILLHSTGHKPGNSEIDVPLNYADYYYLEALSRKRNKDFRE